MRGLPCRAVVACAVVLTAAPAFGDPSAQDVAAARTLFEDARKLMKAGKFQEACPKLEEGVRLNPGLGMRYNLAECYENVGRTASAWALFLDVAAGAKQKKDLEREKIARERAKKLEPKLSHVTVTVAAEVPGLEVMRDTSLLGKGQFGSAISLDPGTYTFSAHAPDHESWEQKVVVGPDGAKVEVKIPKLAEKPKPKAPPPPPPPPPPGLGSQRKVAIAAAAVGLVGIGFGSFFGLRAVRLNEDSKAHCEGNLCDGAGFSLRNDARLAGNVSTVAFIVGALGVGGGIALWVTGAPRAEPRASLVVAPGVAFVRVGGVF